MMTASTTTLADIPIGNIIGSARAETDLQMLKAAFVETADYKALVETQSFNFVVGRRGAGKSALFHRITQHFSTGKGYLTFHVRPEEHESLAIKAELSKVGSDYRGLRAIARLAWRTHILLWVLGKLADHYKLKDSDSGKRLQRRAGAFPVLLRDNSPVRVTKILKAANAEGLEVPAVPGWIADRFQISGLEEDVRFGLTDINRVSLVYFDALDEGWSPGMEPTAVLGGLAAAVADLEEKSTGIHGTLFVRDNIFRALAHFDPDYSRHVEGNTLRLHWDEEALFQVVVERLRVVLDQKGVENPEKVWNQFTSPDLAGREGFERCLHLTLYRPRDILTLVNRAYVLERRAGGFTLTGNAVDSAATDISNDRLDDLLKEYDQVLPGIRSFAGLFIGQPARQTIPEVTEFLQEEIDSGAYDNEADSDFALLGSGGQVLNALYGIGFLGFEDKAKKKVIFCHDGSGAELDQNLKKGQLVVHPCYWKALEVRTDETVHDVVVEVNDEFDTVGRDDLGDLRFKRLGRVLTRLDGIPTGLEGASAFEDWVLLAVKVLFAGKLGNPELHPNGAAVQRRDVVATNIAEEGLWRRIKEDYGSRQVVFEVKNYEDLKPEDYRQILSYTTGEYGKFGIIVHRGKAEGVAEKHRAQLRSLYHEHQRLVLTVPESVLRRSISKLRNVDRFDYVEDQLGKRIDTLVRKYLALGQLRRYARKSGKKRKRKT